MGRVEGLAPFPAAPNGVDVAQYSATYTVSVAVLAEAAGRCVVHLRTISSDPHYDNLEHDISVLSVSRWGVAPHVPLSAGAHTEWVDLPAVPDAVPQTDSQVRRLCGPRRSARGCS